MTLYEQWTALVNEERDQDAYNAFWGEYLPKEQGIYEEILADTSQTIQGTVASLAPKFDMDSMTFLGFLDGINSSLESELDLNTITEDTEIALNVALEKLYYNMLDAQAEWLYTLPEWDNVLTDEKRKEIKKAYNATKTIVKDKKVGRNDPCPCGSGLKYKHCCLKKA